MKKIIPGIVFLSGLSLALEVHAQRELEEIVVTAQKTRQNVQDVPISIAVLSGEMLREANTNTLAEMILYVPNVTSSSEGQYSEEVYIRGFGTNPFNPSFESSVGLVQDDVYYGRTSYFAEPRFDVDRLEVLRGPQGTLFGKNTVAGVFSITSRPVTEELSLNFEVGVSENGGRKVELGAGAMLNGWFGLRVSLFDLEYEGELYNGFLDRQEENPDQRAQRIKLLFVPGDRTELEFTALRTDTDSNFWALQLMNLDQGTRDYLLQFDPNVEDDPLDFHTSFNVPGEFTARTTETNVAKLTHDFDGLKSLNQLNTTLILAHTNADTGVLADLDVSPADLSTLNFRDFYEQYTLEWRFAGIAESLFGLGGPVEFVAGLYAFNADFDFLGSFSDGDDNGSFLLTEDTQQLAGPLFVAIPALVVLQALQGDQFYELDFDRNMKSLALFGQFTWRLADRWLLTPGVRISKEKQIATASGTMYCDRVTGDPGEPCALGFILGASDYAYEDSRRDETDIAPKLSLNYELSDSVNFYATAAQAFKSGGYNALSFTGEQLTYGPEESITLELGAKGQYFNNSLRLNLGLFQTELKDLQVLAFNGVFFDVRNAASAVSRGIEADWNWLSPAPWFTFNGAVGYIDAKYRDYPGAPAPIYEGLNTQQNLAGERLAFTPELSAAISPQFQLPITETIGTSLVIDILYASDKYSDTDLDENGRVPETTRVNARINVGAIDRSWSITVGGKNLTNVIEINKANDAPFFPGTYYVQQAPGRELYAAFRLKL